MNFLRQPGFLGTHAPFLSDLTFNIDPVYRRFVYHWVAARQAQAL